MECISSGSTDPSIRQFLTNFILLKLPILGDLYYDVRKRLQT